MGDHLETHFVNRIFSETMFNLFKKKFPYFIMHVLKNNCTNMDNCKGPLPTTSISSILSLRDPYNFKTY